MNTNIFKQNSVSAWDGGGHGHQLELFPTKSNQLAPESKNKAMAALEQMSPYAFEEVTRRYLEDLADIQNLFVSKKSHDQGLDGFGVLSGKFPCAFQAKKTSARTGRPDINNFVGSMHSNNIQNGFFISAAGFTRQALQCAQKTPGIHVELIDGKAVIDWLANSAIFLGGYANVG